jgi:hypothetical protein
VTRTVLRIACVLALGVIIAAVGVPSSAHARVTPSMVPSAAPAAAIDIPGLFGDENEPDENEADEGGPEGGTSAGQGSQSPGVSLPVVLVVWLIALLVGGYAAIRLRRLWLRLRGWGSDLRARF